MRRKLLCVVAVLLSAIAAFAEPPVRKVSLDEARQLVSTAAKTRQQPNPFVENVGQEPDPRFDFYFFDVRWSSASGQEHSVEWYAVDVNTGDVWSGIVCRQIRSKSLAKALQLIRKDIGLTEREYRKVKRSGPMCGP